MRTQVCLVRKFVNKAQVIKCARRTVKYLNPLMKPRLSNAYVGLFKT